MKVLQKPIVEKHWSIKVYCTGFGHDQEGCGARLKVYREDLRRDPGEPGVREPVVTFKCICCGALTDIGIEHYPENYRELKPYKASWIKNANST